MTTKKTSRFFGLIRERGNSVRTVTEPVTAEPQVAQADAVWPLMRTLQLSSHADDRRLTKQEKQLAWDAPVRSDESAEVPPSGSTSKARLLAPALEQMRQTQATMTAGYLPVVDNGREAANVSETPLHARGLQHPMQGTEGQQAASSKQPVQLGQQTASHGHAPAAALISGATTTQARPQVARQALPATIAVDGWQYTVMLQATEESASAPVPASAVVQTSAASGDESSISKMFQRLRAHGVKPPAPAPAPAAAAPKAPGFLNKLWAK